MVEYSSFILSVYSLTDTPVAIIEVKREVIKGCAYHISRIVFKKNRVLCSAS